MGDRKNFNKFRKFERDLKIKSVKNATLIKVEHIVRADWDSLRDLPQNELFKFAKKAVDIATRRRKNTLKIAIEQDLPLPQAFRNWRFKNASDDFSLKNAKVKDELGLKDLLGDDYNKGFATIDMSVNSNMSKNELLHKIRVASDFLDNETSTITGLKDYLNKFVKRIEEKGGFKISREDYKDFWRVYNQLEKEGYISKENVYGESNKIQQAIYQVGVAEGTFDKDTIIDRVIARLKGDYEEKQVEDEYDNFFEYRPD